MHADTREVLLVGASAGYVVLLAVLWFLVVWQLGLSVLFAVRARRSEEGEPDRVKLTLLAFSHAMLALAMAAGFLGQEVVAVVAVALALALRVFLGRSAQSHPLMVAVVAGFAAGVAVAALVGRRWIELWSCDGDCSMSPSAIAFLAAGGVVAAILAAAAASVVLSRRS